MTKVMLTSFDEEWIVSMNSDSSIHREALKREIGDNTVKYNSVEQKNYI